MTTIERPLISIIVPVYNGSDYMREAIDSILNQSYSGIEVIVVNDGSDDGGKTEAIALSYGDSIRYFSKPNGGVSSAVNFGLKQMKGEWFCWLSHDDVFSKDRLAFDVQVMQNQPDAKVIFCRINKINASGQIIETIKYPIDHVANPKDILTLRGVDMCSLTIRRECLKTTGLFNESNRTTQDTEMSLRLATSFRFFFNPIVGVSIREHPNRVYYRLNSIHKKDQLIIAQVIHDELTINAFFPDLDTKKTSESVDAWIWMGSQYLSFGSKAYADEAFENALASSRSSTKWLTAYLYIALLRVTKRLLNPRMRSFIKGLINLVI